MTQKTVDSTGESVKQLFSGKFVVDFYQREYVWEQKQIEDLVSDLSRKFLENWSPSHTIEAARGYDPYFMGEIILAINENERSAVIDGQQRITSLTLLMIYILNEFKDVPELPKSILEGLIYSNDYGTMRFNLDVPERTKCLSALFSEGTYTPTTNDTPSVFNIVERYGDIADCWNTNINQDNIAAFAFWLTESVKFSKVWTNNDDFAYVIFETMNDRGLSLTQIEMLRSYLLANVVEESRLKAMDLFDSTIMKLMNLKALSNQKSESEFFKIYFRSQLAQSMSQSKGGHSDFQRIGSEFHRWVRDEKIQLGLNTPDDYLSFIEKLAFYANVYVKINDIIVNRDSSNYLYVIVNYDYNFTMQPAPILASIQYKDDEETVEKKIKLVSKYFTKILSWKVWNHQQISQSALEATVFGFCKELRGKTVEELEILLKSDPLKDKYPSINMSVPTLNQQNKKKIRVLLSLITEIVASNSGESDYMLNKKKIEVEHIWADHHERHIDEIPTTEEFAQWRNNIGDLLVLPEKFNKSYNDAPYAEKSIHYIEQNTLAQTLHRQKYENNPGFIRFKEESGLNFKPYEQFDKKAISERANLYRNILLYNWDMDAVDSQMIEDNSNKEIHGQTKSLNEEHLDLPLYVYLKKNSDVEARSYDAEGMYFGKGKVAVLEGSKAATQERSSIGANISNARKEFIGARGIVSEDVEFETPSAASDFVKGQPSSGWSEWKTEDGRSLNEITERTWVTRENPEQHDIRMQWWNAFQDYAFKNQEFAALFNRTEARDQCWLTFGIVQALCKLRPNPGRVGCEIWIGSSQNRSNNFLDNKDSIEQETGIEFDWQKRRIIVEEHFNVSNQDNWSEQFEWLSDKMIKMQKVFSSYY